MICNVPPESVRFPLTVNVPEERVKVPALITRFPQAMVVDEVTVLPKQSIQVLSADVVGHAVPPAPQAVVRFHVVPAFHADVVVVDL